MSISHRAGGSHGTGSLRAARWAALTRDWPRCEHVCARCHRRFEHKIAPGVACHIRFVMSHLDCARCWFQFRENYRG